MIQYRDFMNDFIVVVFSWLQVTGYRLPVCCLKFEEVVVVINFSVTFNKICHCTTLTVYWYLYILRIFDGRVHPSCERRIYYVYYLCPLTPKLSN